MKGKRLIKPSFLEDDVYSVDQVSEELEKGSDLSRRISSHLGERTSKKRNSSKDVLKKFNTKNDTNAEKSVLGTLISSLSGKEDEVGDSSSLSDKNEIKKAKKYRRKEKSNKASKRKDSGSDKVDLTRLLEEIDDMVENKKNLCNRSDISDSFNTQNGCDSEYDRDNDLNFLQVADNQEDLATLTDLEKAILPMTKRDYDETLGLNEWLPYRFMELKSEIVRKLDEDTVTTDNNERCEFFYSQWIEQYGYLSTLTGNFKREIGDCFVQEGQIPSVKDVKNCNEDLFLDPKDDKMLFTVQDMDGRVILNRLVQIANSQQKQIDEMNKANRFGVDVDNYEFRKEFGVISKKAREKLWWLCRMAEHCGLIGREGRKMKYYLVSGNEYDEVNEFILKTASINSSADITMEIFDQDSEVKKSDSVFLNSVNTRSNCGDLFEDEDNSEQDGYSERMNKDNNSDEEPNEIEIKWSKLSSLTVKNKTRPWEVKKIVESSNPQIIERAIEKDKTDPKINLFKFMLKNIGPRPLWTVKSAPFGKYDSESDVGIEIEPPSNLSLREQGKLRIKWIQMRNQAEKLAIHHFKIIDPETNELKRDKLEYWSDLFGIKLFIPTFEISRINKDNDLDGINVGKKHDLTSRLEPTSGFEKSDINNSNSGYEKRSCFLPLDVEYISEDEYLDNLSEEARMIDIKESKENRIEESEMEDESGDEDHINTIEEIHDTSNIPTGGEMEVLKDDFCESANEKVCLREIDEEVTEADIEHNADNDEDEKSNQQILKKQKEAYKKYLAIRRNRRRFRKKMMEKYGHLLEDEAEESDEDGIQVLRREMEEESFDSYDEDLDWDELSGFSDFIDDSKYENELDGDAIQAHLKHMKQIEERQYKQLFTLEGLRERKSKTYGLLSELNDDVVDGETRLEKKNNQVYNPAYFDDVVSEYWTDEEDYEYDSDGEIDERNMVGILGIDYNEWQRDYMENGIRSSDETINAMRKEKYELLKDALLKEASSQINVLKQRIYNLGEKVSKDISELEKASLKEKYLANANKLRDLLKSIHSACNKCIYENHQYFDHIDILKYIEKRKENKLSRNRSTKSNRDNNLISKKNKNNILNKVEHKCGISNYSDSDDELIMTKQMPDNKKNVLNVRGGRFIIGCKENKV